MSNTKQIFKIKFSYFFIFIFIFINLPKIANASELYIESSKAEYRPGDIFIANLRIDNQSECINAIRGNIEYSKDLLEVQDFIKGDSILVFWVEDPFIDFNRGFVSFAGGIPGGYCGKINKDSGLGNIIGKIIFKATNSSVNNIGLAQVKFLDTSEVLLNDGLGTKAGLSFKGLSLKIAESSQQASDEWQEEKKDDSIPPDPFTVEIDSEPEIFGNKYFAVFNASDKQTGIDHYEVRENNGQWVISESPYLLNDQNLENLEVKAIDKAGNERIAVLKNGKINKNIVLDPISKFYYIAIILLGVLLIWLIIKRIIPKIQGKK